MNAIQLLKQDHEKLRGLLAELAATTKRATKRRGELLEQVSHELEAHTKIEEEIFYPAFRKAGERVDDARMYFEALEEHRAAGEMVLPDLLKTATDTEQFSGRAKVLKELVEHHAAEEERDMFPRARELMDTTLLKELGERMADRKRSLLAGARAISDIKQAGRELGEAGMDLAGAVTAAVLPDDDDAAERGLGGSSRRTASHPQAGERNSGSRARNG